MKDLKKGTLAPAKKTGWKLWLGILIGAVAVGVAWLIWYQLTPPKEVQVEQEVTKEVTKEVSIYQNDEYDYKFQIPDSWEGKVQYVESGNTTHFKYIATDEPNEDFFNITVYTQDEWSDLEGTPAYLPNNVIESNDLVYVKYVEVAQPYNLESNQNEWQALWDTIDDALSTFELTEQSQ